ncbi:hypothetical protein KPZU09_13590 [Klebsiella pneumoniae]|uniref:Uncharacterized protein n=1 Tax=Klebsiella pneumoniae TaxID=573 RepID=A0A919HQH2_KLEPN|nr:hypothetical protein KPZU09_13590 [Klebsiella pneumoniae]
MIAPGQQNTVAFAQRPAAIKLRHRPLYPQMKIAVQIAPILKRQRRASGLRAALWLRAWYRFWKSAEVLFMCLS